MESRCFRTGLKIFFCPVLKRLDSILAPSFMNSVKVGHAKICEKSWNFSKSKACEPCLLTLDFDKQFGVLIVKS